MKNKLRSKKRLGFEQLESRIALAGNVSVAKSSAGDLVITGDNASNRIAVLQLDSTSYEIRGLYEGNGNTKINGSTAYYVIRNITGSISIAMNNGHDNVHLAHMQGGKTFAIKKNLTIYGDRKTTAERNASNPSSDYVGYDKIDLTNLNVKGSLSVYTQKGDDTVLINNTRVYGTITVKTGYDNDFVRMINVYGSTNIDIDTAANGDSSAADEVILDEVRAGYVAYPNPQGRLQIRTGKGNDVVEIRDTKTDYFTCYLLGGDDYLNLIRVAWDNSWDAQGGSGRDRYNRYPGPGASSGYSGFEVLTYNNVW